MVKIILLYGILGITCFYFVGISIRKLYTDLVTNWIQSVVGGACIILLIFRMEFFIGFSRNISVALIFLLLGYGILVKITELAPWWIQVRSCTSNLNPPNIKSSIFDNVSLYLIATLPLCAVSYLGFAFFSHIGPDLEGYLLSSAYQLSGGNYASLISSFKEATNGDGRWWLPIEVWKIPDFRKAVAIEFFFRAARTGFQGLSIFYAQIFHVDIWVGHILGINFSIVLMSFLFSELLKGIIRSSITRNFIILGFIYSPFFLILYFENIHAQLMSAGFYLYFFLFLYKRLKSKVNTIEFIMPCFVLLTACTIFAEGMQIYLFSSIISALSIFILFPFSSENNRIKLLWQLKNLITIGVLFVILDLIYIVIFSGWTYLRLIQGFPGGALHLNGTPILFFYPNLLVAGITQNSLDFNLLGIKYSNYQWYLIFSMAAVLFIRNKNILPIIVIGAFIPPIIIGNNYAIFKVASFYFPLIYLFTVILISEIPKIAYKKITIILFILINTISSLNLIHKFISNARVITIESLNAMKIAYSGHSGRNLITRHPGHHYFLFGMYGPIRYLNSGWGANYYIDNSYENKIFFYEDCSIDPIIRCSTMNNNTSASMSIESIKTNYFLSKDGVVDQIKIKTDLEKYILND